LVFILVTSGLKAGYDLLWLTEDIGLDGVITRDLATTFFVAGTQLTAKHVGVHETTGRPSTTL
jgi:hypothetical protein